MTYVSSHPILDIREYLLAELYLSGLLVAADYVTDFGQVHPIFPENQTPESNSLFKDKPFLLYSVETPSVVGTQYWLMSGESTVTAYSDEYQTVLDLQIFMLDLFRRFEITAQEINEIADINSFLTVFISNSDASNEPDSEYGRYSSSVTIGYQYTRPISGNGKFAF